MQNVVPIATTAAITLIAAQAAILLVRIPSSPRRFEPLLLAAFILSASLMLIAPGGDISRSAIVVFMIWAGGAFLARAVGRRIAAWTGGSVAFLLVLFLAAALGYQATIPFMAFRAFGAALLVSVVLRSLWRLWRASRSISILMTLISVCLLLAAGAVDLVLPFLHLPFPRLHVWAVLLLVSCTSWLVFQEGYPSGVGWMGRLGQLRQSENRMRAVSARLLATENALVYQDRLVASGILALGAAHEFKNALAAIRATAQHGIEQADAERKDASLRLLIEHAEAGKSSTIGLLEKISREGRDVAHAVDAARDLPPFIRMVRAAFRGEGIVIETDLDHDVLFCARKSEVEQILLNLVRNAAEAYRRLPSMGRGSVTISARRVGDSAVLEVTDRAGGVPPDVEHKLFTSSFSESGSTGLGLYLSKSLALANDGSLEYQPTEGGSIFRLTFTVVDEEPPAAGLAEDGDEEVGVGEGHR